MRVVGLSHGRRRRIAPALCVILVAAGASGCGDLSSQELNRGVESLSAIAAQGGLLANGVARDATKSTYTRVMAKTLGGEAEHEAEKLADATPEARVKPQRDDAVALGERIASYFSKLQTYPGEE